MKKIICIPIILLLFISQLGYYLIYSFRQYELKAEMERTLLATIPECRLEVFIAEEHSPDLTWEEQDKEFSLNGELYDVVRIKKANGKTLLFCVNDKKEEQLLKEFSKAAIAATNAKDPQSGKHTIKFEPSCFTVAALEKTISPSIPERHFYYELAFDIRLLPKAVTAPPPRM